ncbi:hypothetical protein [Nitrospirillum pindoramense]|uniref:Uncharacterized protein n=1 Tax=Nitrospirillum amazonense TaxID=28077 RepID=A0A560HHA0_9PROT|nr:hypothetical protein [Nitrospirillum amazonense]TWB45838.1 hypothetical protein FBZ90_101173 [Nitrospirillum amazonense]
MKLRFLLFALGFAVVATAARSAVLPSYWTVPAQVTLVQDVPEDDIRREPRANRSPRETFEDVRRARDQERGKPVAREIDHQAYRAYAEEPGKLEGRPFAEVERELDQRLVDEAGWKKMPLTRGDGVGYVDGKGGSIQLNEGYPEGREGGNGDELHRGPYAKIMPENIRVPLKGNPVLERRR